ncbi:MAG: FtsX-like permease family protein, partial [Bacteroidota bacterium]
AFLLVVPFGSLLSGLYPAFVLASFKPVSVLKSLKVTNKRGLSLRKGLIAFQFLIAVLLISGTYLVYQQITFMKQKDLGFDMEKILVINGPRVVLETIKKEGSTLSAKYKPFINQIVGHHTISAISATSHIPGRDNPFSVNFRKLEQFSEEVKTGNAAFVDTSFIKTFGMEFLAKGIIPQKIKHYEWLIINEKTLKILEYKSPQEALYQKLIVFGDTLEIVGVVNNIHWNSLKEDVSPMLYALDNEYGAYFSIKMDLSDIPATIAHIESVYKKAFPTDPFHYFFLDETFNKQYQADLQFGNLFSVFSILAIFIACLGLFALVSFSATLRMKEIGIRKVLGASISNLMILLSSEYLVLLLISIIVAIPVIIIGGKGWLENYAYKIEMGFDLFLIPALALLLISLVTVSYRTYVSAKVNPVNALRKE